ncbi:MAG TPA: tripartite tricarboxylate transporter TctB family protein [Thermodesulfobacteriota bacterium]|nr:tripartite tricarboxylate transporter TctB family protein [Thermodesulfobacteriota bacterium]
MRRRDLISGSAFLVLAILLFFQAKKLTLWGELGPAEGFFPMGLSLVFAGLSVLILIQALLKPVEAGERVGIIDLNRKKFFAYVGLFFGFGILFPIVGYTLILAAFLVIILRWVEKQSWKITILVTILLIGGSNLLFVGILKISMPEGLLSSAFSLWP